MNMINIRSSFSVKNIIFYIYYIIYMQYAAYDILTNFLNIVYKNKLFTYVTVKKIS